MASTTARNSRARTGAKTPADKPPAAPGPNRAARRRAKPATPPTIEQLQEALKTVLVTCAQLEQQVNFWKQQYLTQAQVIAMLNQPAAPQTLPQLDTAPQDIPEATANTP